MTPRDVVARLREQSRTHSEYATYYPDVNSPVPGMYLERAQELTTAADCIEALIVAHEKLTGEMLHLMMNRISPPSTPEGWVLVPLIPTEEMWGGLARQIVMWTRFDRPTGSALHSQLRLSRTEVPEWLKKEIRDVDHVPAKGDVAAAICRAMVEARPNGERTAPLNLTGSINTTGRDSP